MKKKKKTKGNWMGRRTGVSWEGSPMSLAH